MRSKTETETQCFKMKMALFLIKVLSLVREGSFEKTGGRNLVGCNQSNFQNTDAL